MNRLDVDDPFIVKSSDQVIDFVKTCVDEHVYGFSVDVTDLYYSIPHDQLLPAVEECLDLFGSVRFQTECGVPVSRFLELLSFYLKSTYISWDDKHFIQKDGICIGSCIAPILSDIFLSRSDRSINLHLDNLNIKKVFRYVDDYLVLLTNDTVTNYSYRNNYFALAFLACSLVFCPGIFFIFFLSLQPHVDGLLQLMELHSWLIHVSLNRYRL